MSRELKTVVGDYVKYFNNTKQDVAKSFLVCFFTQIFKCESFEA